jgi:hypothetical protein
MRGGVRQASSYVHRTVNVGLSTMCEEKINLLYYNIREGE